MAFNTQSHWLIITSYLTLWPLTFVCLFYWFWLSFWIPLPVISINNWQLYVNACLLSMRTNQTAGLIKVKSHTWITFVYSCEMEDQQRGHFLMCAVWFHMLMLSSSREALTQQIWNVANGKHSNVVITGWVNWLLLLSQDILFYIAVCTDIQYIIN